MKSLCSLIAVIVGLGMLGVDTARATLFNAGFEDDGQGTSPPSSWLCGPAGNQIVAPSGWAGVYGSTPDGSAQFCAIAGNYLIGQDSGLVLQPNTTYQLTFDLLSRNDQGGPIAASTWVLAGNSGLSGSSMEQVVRYHNPVAGVSTLLSQNLPGLTLLQTQQDVTYSFTTGVTVPSSKDVYVVFMAQNVAGTAVTAAGIDNVRFNALAVPEPSTILLLALGGALAFRRNRGAAIRRAR